MDWISLRKENVITQGNNIYGRRENTSKLKMKDLVNNEIKKCTC